MLCEPSGGPEALKQGTEEARAVSDGGDLSFRGCFTTSGDILGRPSWAWNEVVLLALMCRGQGILLICRTIPTAIPMLMALMLRNDHFPKKQSKRPGHRENNRKGK